MIGEVPQTINPGPQTSNLKPQTSYQFNMKNILPYIPERPAKPRQAGLTMVMDKGSQHKGS